MSVVTEHPTKPYNWTLGSIKGGDTVFATRREIKKGCGCEWRDEFPSTSYWLLCAFHEGYEQAIDEVMCYDGSFPDLDESLVP